MYIFLKFSDQQTISSQKMCDHINVNTPKILKPWIPNPIPNSFILIHVPKNILHLQLKLTVNGPIFSWFGCCGFSPVWTKNLTAMINNCSLSSQYIPHLNQIMCKSWGWHWWFLMLVFEIKKDFPFFQLFIKKKKKKIITTVWQYCITVRKGHNLQRFSEFAERILVYKDFFMPQ